MLEHEKVLLELKDHRNSLNTLKENMKADCEIITEYHSQQMNELKKKLFQSEKNTDDLKTKLTKSEKNAENLKTFFIYILLLIMIMSFAGLVGGILHLLDPDSIEVCKMDRNGLQLENSDWKTKYLFERQRNEDLTAEIADKSEEMQNLAAINDLFKNYFDFKIWTLLAWYICFRPPRYFTAFLLGLWTIFGI